MVAAGPASCFHDIVSYVQYVLNTPVSDPNSFEAPPNSLVNTELSNFELLQIKSTVPRIQSTPLWSCCPPYYLHFADISMV